MDLNVAKEAQKPFYQPMQLQDIENMVEISSDSSNDSPARAQRRAERDIDKQVEYLRKKKTDEQTLKTMREAMLNKKKKRFNSRGSATGP